MNRCACLPLASLLLLGLAGIVSPSIAEPDFDAAFLGAPHTATLRGIVIADFNEDGVLDIVANERGGKYLVRLGDGTGQPVIDAGVAEPPRSSSPVTTGDLNGDGHLDLVLAYGPGVSVAVRLGAGDGTFGPETDYVVGGTLTNSVALGDLNEDGFLDLAAVTTVSGDAGPVSVWLGVGDGTFGPRVDLTNNDIPMEVILVDLDGDGHRDIVYSDRYSSSLAIRPGHGDGTFGGAYHLPASLYPLGVGAGKLHGDDRIDLAVVNMDDSSVAVHRNNGGGSYTSTLYPVGGRPYGLAIADYDGDGDLDIVTVNNQYRLGSVGNTITILLNDGNCVFTRFADVPVGLAPNAVQAGDLTGDGHPDLAMTFTTIKVLATMVGNGDGTFGVPSQPTGMSPTSLALGDLNADGRPDMLTVDEYDATLSVRLGLPGRAFGSRMSYPIPAFPSGVATGDLNHDPWPDVVVSAGGVLSVFPGGTGGALGARADISAGTVLRSPYVVDLNQDGHADIVAAEWATSVILILWGNGAGGFSATTLASFSATTWVRPADLDGDDIVDLVVANSDSRLSVFRGLGGGTFAARVDYPTGSGPYTLDVGDFDADGHPDVVVCCRSGLMLSVFRGSATGALTRLSDITGYTNPGGVAFVDADNDGRLDIATVMANMVAVQYGAGDGTFPRREYYGVGLYPTHLVRGDLDLDGAPDLATANYGNSDSMSSDWPGSFSILWGRHAASSGVADAPRVPAGLRVWPNPAAGPVTMALALERAVVVRLSIFDAAGRRVVGPESHALGAGDQRLVWDGRGADGRTLPPGQYYLRLSAPDGARWDGRILLTR